MPKTRQPKPAKKPKTPSPGRKRSPGSASRSSSPTTTPSPSPLNVLDRPLREKDVEKIISILRETVDQITEQHGRQLERLYATSQDHSSQLQGLSHGLDKIRKRMNEAAVALLQK